MKKCIFVFLMLNFLYSIAPTENSYSKAVYIDENGYFVENSNKKNSWIKQVVDLREINQLEKNKDYKKLNELFKLYVEQEKELDVLPKFQIYNYIMNERNELRNSKFDWVNKNEKYFKDELTKAIKSNNYNEKLFPYSFIVGGLYYYHSETLNRYDTINYLVKKIKNNFIIGELVQASNGYILPLYNDKNIVEYMFYIRKIENSIYEKLNNNYELSAILYSGGEIDIDNYKKWDGTSIEQKFIYGNLDIAGYFIVDNSCLIKVKTLNLRQSPAVSNNIIGSLKLNDKVKIIEIGNYEAINNVGANWLKIITGDEKIGWIFGSHLYIYYDYEKFTK